MLNRITEAGYKNIFKLTNNHATLNHASMSIQKIVMKNIIGAFGLAFLIIVFSVSCKKNNSGGSSTKPVLTLSSSSVKRNQPLVASTNVISSNLVVRWSVNSPDNSWISPSGNKSIILFSNSGSYTVTASYFADSAATTPYDSSSSPVTVTDSIYNDSTGTWASCNSLVQVPINVNDQIFLTPVSYSDTGLVFVAHTQQTYGNQYPLLDYSLIPDTTSGYGFVFGMVTENPCSNFVGDATPATGILSISSLIQGANDFTIFFNGVAYEGTLTVTNTTCTFSWNYTSGVMISPLTITKQ
jgi:hypothetical protein